MPQLSSRLGSTAAPSASGRPCAFNEKSYPARAPRHAPVAAKRAAVSRAVQAAGGTCAPSVPVDRQEVIDLVAFVLAHEAEATRRYVQTAAQHHSVESLCDGLLASAARHLGAMWDEDLCSFADVTIGLLRLQHALHGLAPSASPCRAGGVGVRRILLAPVPGEPHTFGLTMVQGSFNRAGWQVAPCMGSTLPELVRQVGEGWFGIIGLSAGSERTLGRAGQCIRQLRRASQNRQVGIMVGGPVFILRPELAAELGADATAADGPQAIRQAENLLGLCLGAY